MVRSAVKRMRISTAMYKRKNTEKVRFVVERTKFGKKVMITPKPPPKRKLAAAKIE